MRRAALVLALCLASCSPRIVERVTVLHDTTTVHHRDTTYRRDSVYIREWMQGDTVFVDRYRDRYVYRDRWRDSIQIKVDSFAVERVKYIQVEKHLTSIQKAKIGAFPWLLLIVVLLAVWTYRKPLGGLITKIGKMIF